MKRTSSVPVIGVVLLGWSLVHALGQESGPPGREVSQAKPDTKVALPKSELDKPPPENLITIHLTKKGNILFDGKRIGELGATLKRRVKAIRAGGKDPKSAVVVIRADAAAKTGDVQKLINVCQERGFERFALRAVLPEQPQHKHLAENLVRHERNPVLDLGKPGQWDDGRSGCFTVCKAGDRYYLWYMGSGSKNPWRIGLATSDDGIKWERCPSNPVLPQGPPGEWDDKQVSMPYVLKEPYVLKNGDTFYYMWYCGAGTKRGGGFGLATSTDGIHWKKYPSNPVLRGIGTSCDPCVCKFGDKFIMWYCGKTGGAYRIFRATSPDGIDWKKDRDPALPLGEKGEFDSRHHAGPCVVKVGNTFFLWHLGNNGKKWIIGLATSTDGIHWQKSAANPILDVGGKDAWDSGSILSLDVVWHDGRFHVWYAGVSTEDIKNKEHEQAIRIGYAVSRPCKQATQPPDERSKATK